jgi:hypothetical protein
VGKLIWDSRKAGMAMLARWLRAGAVVAGAAALVYFGFLRDRHLHWGATPQEARGEVAGDDLMPDPDVVATRAVEIDAPPSAVWPWLVQMGPGRGGAYTYDWIENLFGLGMHSATEVLPQLQGPRQGDELPLPNGPSMRIEVLEPERAMVVRSDDGTWVWIFALRPTLDSTRLISRNRIATPGAPAPARLVNMLVMEPGSLVMERKMLLGIKERAERLAREREAAPAGA